MFKLLQLLLLALSGASSAPVGPLYKDAAQPVDVRVADLVARMTVDEKVAQLTYVGAITNKSVAAAIKSGGVGGLQVNTGSAESVAAINALQQALKTNTRLGIPVSMFAETTHSGGVIGSTVFPMPVTSGASWNTTLLEKIGAAIALELRSAGGDQGLGPILQVCTDPRFGRVEENFGEDPFHVSAMGVASVNGLQGKGCGGANVTLGVGKISSQAKHFAVYGAGGRDGYTPMGGGPSERTVFEVYLRPWLKYAQAGGRGVMLAHNMALWTPMHANKRLVTDVLRNRFGLLGGYIGSDMGNVNQLGTGTYAMAHDGSEAVKLAMEAGLDQNMGGQYVTFAKGLVYGTADESMANATLDRAVGNILRKKFASGLFDENAKTDPSALKNLNTPQHRVLAREAARQGLVLLVNNGTNVGRATPPLPADMSRVKNVAVIGQLGGCGAANKTSCLAKVSMLGGYTPGRISGAGIDVTSIEEAFRNRGYNSTWYAGVKAVNGESAADSAKATAAAVAAVAENDLIVVAAGCVGCTCCDSCGCGEAGDRQSFDLEGAQLLMLDAVATAANAAQKQFVVVTICGRPVTFGEGNAVLAKVSAMISAFRPGEEGGSAIADLIVGDYNPSGRLAQNWLRAVGQIYSPANPWYQYSWGGWFANGDRAPTYDPRTQSMRAGSISPLFPFGHGLSYSVAIVSALQPVANVSVSTAADAKMASFTLKATVENTGKTDGATTLFATYSKQTDGVVRFAQMLCGFTKLHVAAGAKAAASVTVRIVDLARWDPEATGTNLLGGSAKGAYVVDGGEYKLSLGTCVDSHVRYGTEKNSDWCKPLMATVTVGTAGGTYIVL